MTNHNTNATRTLITIIKSSVAGICVAGLLFCFYISFSPDTNGDASVPSTPRQTQTETQTAPAPYFNLDDSPKVAPVVTTDPDNQIA